MSEKMVGLNILQDLHYTYDAMGNVLTIQDYLDKTGDTPQTQTFTYDSLDRLTSGKAEYGTNGTYALQSYAYSSSTGNLSSKAGVSYTYGNTNHDHAVTAAGSDTYTYDNNGNQITRQVGGSNYTLSYDAENRLVGVSGAATAAFVYDGDGNRVKGTVNGTTIAYIGNYFEWTGYTTTMRKFYYAGNVRVAMRSGSTTLRFILEDHLGSTSIATDSSGNYQAELRYYPWGERRYGYGSTPTTFQYTGQRWDSGIGLYFYGARYYDPYLNRWIQPDSIIPSDQGINSSLIVDYHETKFLDQLNNENRQRLENPDINSSINITNGIAFDRYSYSNNNPLRFTDPDGHFAFLVPFLAGALIGGAISTAVYAITAQATGQDITLAGAAGAFAGGAVAGVVSVFATPVAGSLLGLAGISASGTALVAGTATVNAVGGAASYLAAGYTQNGVDAAMGNTTTFKPTVGGALVNAGAAGVLSTAVGRAFPVANNTMSTLSQASKFMPGRTLGTLLATENAQHMYSQTLIATGIGYYAGWEYGRRR